MKLLLCEKCWDVFKLTMTMRACECGKVKGRYINNSEAEVSKEAVSIAMGNGSLMNAIINMRSFHQERGDTSNRQDYYEDSNGRISHAWVRPNEGSGNPHCKVIKE